MKRWTAIVQIAFTYIGSVVGAGFATGQEIIQFFTRYGWMATLTIGVTTAFFILVGTRLMVLASELNAQSYEDLNRYLFGDRVGRLFSLFTLIILFGSSSVMLAGAGSVFSEHLGLAYQLGLLFTLGLAFLLLVNGLPSIVAVNSLVVPLMLLCSALSVVSVWGEPGDGAWLRNGGDAPILKIWTAPFLYAAFNLSTAQAVLVPLGAAVKERFVLLWGGALGGLGIGIMLWAGHFALSAHMPDIARYEIPMGRLIAEFGRSVHLLFAMVIFGEIFTTYIANIYGLALQIRQRTGWTLTPIIAVTMLAGYIISQIGFSSLLSVLYPFFGMVSMIWFVWLLGRRRVAPD